MSNRFFLKYGDLISLSPLQISEGFAEGLQELSEAEKQALLNPVPAITVQSLKEAITAKRWQIETGGLTLHTGVHVATGIDDQNRITSVIANAELAGVESVDFKAASGWVSISVADLKAVAAAIALHVQQCFTAERMHHEAIDAIAAHPEGLQQALEAYDTEQGWPSNNATQEAGDE